MIGISIAKLTTKENKHEKKELGFLPEFIYGGIDGAVTTFAVVAGVAGASLSSGVVLVLGFANLIADGFSMAISNYLSTKAENEYIEKERKRKTRAIEEQPEQEKDKLKNICRTKGFQGKDLDRAVEIISSDKVCWTEQMLREELNILESSKQPKKTAFATFAAFITVGFIPLLTYVLSSFYPSIAKYNFVGAIILTGVAFFIVGASKTSFTLQKWWISGLQTLFVGGIAASIAYLVGFLLKGLAG